MPTRGGWARLGRVLLGALLAAALFRASVAEPFRIPSASMSATLLVNDYVLVTKYEYGPRLPVTVGIPMTDLYLRNVQLPYTRLPGLRPPRHGDVAVFNYPLGREELDRRQPYVKRIVGLPGDTLALVRKALVVNGMAVPLPPEAQQRWWMRLHPGRVLPASRLAAMHIEVQRSLGSVFVFDASRVQADLIRRWPEVDTMAAMVRPRAALGPLLFPDGSGYTADDFGPLRVPARGDTVWLNTPSWPLYRDLLRRYEGYRIVSQAGAFVVNGLPAQYIVIQQDYYFVLGDNRDDSEDSRTWGFVPADHLIGRARRIYFSWDFSEGTIRWSRIMRAVR